VKKCVRCKKTKGKGEFFRKGKEYKVCNDCSEGRKGYNRAYNKNNKDKKIRYRASKKEETAKYGKSYRSNNKEKIKKKNRRLYDKTIEEKPFVRCFYSAKQRSKSREMEFSITLDYLESIYPADNICPCFGVSMEHNTEYAPSIDRIDANNGYVVGNVQFISKRANMLKSNASISEIQRIIDYIEDNLNAPQATSTIFLEYLDAPEKYLQRRLREIKSRSSKLGIVFDLVVDDIKIPKICPVLGVPLQITSSKNNPWHPSFDRVNPNLGYVLENVRIISMRANFIKSDGTAEEFKSLLKFMDPK
jgi:hypothetical protein